MNCPTELDCSLYADGALGAEEAAALERHLQECSACTARVAALAAESRMLRSVLTAEDASIPVPRFERPLDWRALLGLGIGTALLAWLTIAAWQTLLGYLPAELRWLNPFEAARAWDLFVGGVFFFVSEGSSMLASFVRTVGVASVVMLAAALVFSRRRPRVGAALAWSIALLAVGLPPAGHALEIRRNQGPVNIAANETIDDTLIVFGESVTIDGNIDGDLIAFSRLLTVRGTVTGDVIGFAQTLAIEGPVGGTVFGFAESVDVRDRVMRNLFGFGRRVNVADTAAVDGNATLFAANGVVRGSVGRDLTSFAGELELRGTVERDVMANGERIRVLAPARIGGQLRARTNDAENVEVATGVSIGGGTDVDVRPDDEAPRAEERSEYFDPSFYVWQVVRVAAAFIIGAVLVWLLPGLLDIRLDSVNGALTAGAVGLAGFILTPILSVILLATIIGIPLGIVGIAAWLLLWYSAKIVVALIIGRRLFETRAGELPHFAALLITGLVVVTIAVNLPYVGWLLNVIVVLLGFGLLVLYFAGRYRGRGDAFTAAPM